MVKESERVKLVILVILTSIITSMVTTKIIAIKYMNIIDGYAKSRMDEIKELVSNATSHKW